MWKDIGCTIIATRAATFDMLTNRYLADHPDATVLHVGCGMDSRVFRIDPPASVQWFDVDYPDVIDLRRQLFPDGRLRLRPVSPDRCTAERFCAGWTRFHGSTALLIAEGVLMYVSEADVKALLNTVVAHFPGGQMIFDVVHPVILKQVGSNVGVQVQPISGDLMILRTSSSLSRSLN